MITLEPSNGWIAVDAQGWRYPWFTSGALEVLDAMDLQGKKLFEWGVGYSTYWFRSRGMKTWGVDSSEKWAKDVITHFEPNKEEYINYPKKYCNFGMDIVVIDGEYRDECAPVAFEIVKKGGIILIDNFFQPSVPPNEWFRTLDLLAVKKAPHTLYPQTGHPDWKSLIIQC